jgi:SAM-dependent methyltransferase
MSFWSEQAELWAEHWGSFTDPVRAELLRGVGPGTRLLDAGCGSGELLAMAAARGAEVSGIDSAEGMLAIARARLPGADLRLGELQRLPWPDGAFDVVTAVNTLQFAPDFGAALAEVARVGRRVHVANWGLREDCDINAVDDALGDEPPPGDALHRAPGGLEAFAAEAGLTVLEAREVDVPFELPDDATVERAFEFEHEGVAPAELRAAAAPFRRPDGSYRFENRFRLLIAESPRAA